MASKCPSKRKSQSMWQISVSSYVEIAVATLTFSNTPPERSAATNLQARPSTSTKMMTSLKAQMTVSIF